MQRKLERSDRDLEHVRGRLLGRQMLQCKPRRAGDAADEIVTLCRRFQNLIGDSRDRQDQHDARDAEECVDDALLAAWNSIPPNRPESFRVYLGTLVRNAALDRWRRGNAKKRKQASVSSLEELQELASACDVEQTVGANELSRLITDYLNTLGEIERSVFVRRYWCYEPIETICKRYGFGKSKVKMMLKRTRDKLAKRLREEGYPV